MGVGAVVAAAGLGLAFLILGIGGMSYFGTPDAPTPAAASVSRSSEGDTSRLEMDAAQASQDFSSVLDDKIVGSKDCVSDVSIPISVGVVSLLPTSIGAWHYHCYDRSRPPLLSFMLPEAT